MFLRNKMLQVQQLFLTYLSLFLYDSGKPKRSLVTTIYLKNYPYYNGEYPSFYIFIYLYIYLHK